MAMLARTVSLYGEDQVTHSGLRLGPHRLTGDLGPKKDISTRRFRLQQPETFNERSGSGRCPFFLSESQRRPSDLQAYPMSSE